MPTINAEVVKSQRKTNECSSAQWFIGMDFYQSTFWRADSWIEYEIIL